MTAEVVERRQRQRGNTGEQPVAESHEVHEAVTAVHAVPRVDLVPPIVDIRRRHNALERKLLAGLVVLFAFVVAAGLAVSILAILAENNLTAERTRSEILLNDQKSYQELSTVKAQLGAYDSAEVAALFPEADWSRLMRELDAVLPADVSLVSETVRVKGLTSVTAGGFETTGLDAPGVIEIEFSATADRFDSPTPLLNALAGLTGYVSATVDAVAASTDAGYTITGVVELGTDALGGTARVAALDPELVTRLHEQLDTVATTAPAAATTTDDATASQPGN